MIGPALLNVALPGIPIFLRSTSSLRWIFLVIPAIFWALGGYILISTLISRAWAIALLTHPMRSLFLMLGLIALALWYLITYLGLFWVFAFRKQKPRLKTLMALLLVPLMLLTSGVSAYAANLVNISRDALGNIFLGPSGADVDPMTPYLQPVDGRYNFLVMGGDAGEDREGRRPDSIIVVSVDAQSGQATTVSIPRNFQNAPFPASSPMNQIYPEGYNCGDNCIINSLYTEVTQNYQNLYPGEKDPGAQAMMDATSGILGLPIQAYVIVDMANFSQLIDLMGGVKINAGGWVPISGAALDNYGTHLPPEGWIAPGVQTLDGYQALWYARSREYTTDYARSQRQQCVVQAMVKQMDPLKVLTRFGELAKAGQQIMESDITTEQLSTFLDLAIKSQNEPVKRLTLGPPDFGVNFSTYPDFSEIRSKVKELLDPNYPTATASPSASASAESTNGASSASPSPTSGASPSPSGPPITQERLQRLAELGDTDTLVGLLANNGDCSPG